MSKRNALLRLLPRLRSLMESHPERQAGLALYAEIHSILVPPNSKSEDLQKAVDWLLEGQGRTAGEAAEKFGVHRVSVQSAKLDRLFDKQRG